MTVEKLTKEAISNILFNSKDTADVHFGDLIVRMNGEIEANYFLANPYSMFWLAEEDSQIWPWNLETEKKQNVLSEAERQAAMDAVNAYGKHPNGQIFFMTKELEGYAVELAEKVRDKKMSKLKAASLLKASFPGYPRGFYKNEIDCCYNGYIWYK